MPENSIAIRVEVKNQKAREELQQVISAIQGYCILRHEDLKPYDILIYEISGEDLSKEFEYVSSVKTSGLVKHVFLTSATVGSDILIQALRAGAEEFFAQPINRDEVRNTFLKFKEQQPYSNKTTSETRSKQGIIIDIFGSKGGVGTTTIAVNLANSLVESDNGSSVALIDMNILFGEIPLFLDLTPAFNWAEVSKNIDRLDALYLMSIFAKHPSGLYVLPAPPRLDGVNSIPPQIIETILRLMQTVFDFIIIDSGQSLDETSLQILKQSHTIALVSILNYPCLINTKKLINTFQHLGYPSLDRVKVVINRNNGKSSVSLKEAEKSINKRIFWSIPNDYYTTMSAINQGKTLSTVAHKSEINKNIKEFASALLEKDGSSKKKEKASFWGLKKVHY